MKRTCTHTLRSLLQIYITNENILQILIKKWKISPNCALFVCLLFCLFVQKWKCLSFASKTMHHRQEHWGSPYLESDTVLKEDDSGVLEMWVTDGSANIKMCSMCHNVFCAPAAAAAVQALKLPPINKQTSYLQQTNKHMNRKKL